MKIGPFNLGDKSKIVGVISMIWLTVTSIILLFPQEIHPTEGITFENFNYTAVVVIFTMFIAAIHWYLPEKFGGAKHHF